MQTQFELFPRLPIVKNPNTYWARYRAYLRSSLWAWVRQETLAIADYRCQAGKPGCSTIATECHHTSYLRWGREGDRPGVDTVATCANCHGWIHARPIITKDAANDNLPPEYIRARR